VPRAHRVAIPNRERQLALELDPLWRQAAEGTGHVTRCYRHTDEDVDARASPRILVPGSFRTSHQIAAVKNQKTLGRDFFGANFSGVIDFISNRDCQCTFCWSVPSSKRVATDKGEL